ncbi:hypothetical protein NA57DRAFT_57663 [Rhizodiscina lignyota]|uniref:Multiple myeloma tumor-associated protein 2-like N-terminal domain-containing protein n=1 Tax=Rhizodiscina lignyota TaxID=1504668 RepID=A0A9P4I8B4_9PEZI|nr:hypothetical protein NA57DRAFT_57663 [Rhizodiscina lignyota]
MDLVHSIRKEGSRGGRGEFKWDDVKLDKDRENYLGHSLMAPVGRWQKNRDLSWYSKGDVDEEAKLSEADRRKEEIRKIKEAEEDAMATALGLPPPNRAKDNPNIVELGPSKIAQPAAEERALRREEPQREEVRHRRHRDDDREYDRRERRKREDDRERYRRRSRSRSPRQHDRRREDDRVRRRDARSRSRSPHESRDKHRRRSRSRSISQDRRAPRRNRSPNVDRYRERSPMWRKRRREELDSDSQATSPSPQRDEGRRQREEYPQDNRRRDGRRNLNESRPDARHDYKRR